MTSTVQQTQGKNMPTQPKKINLALQGGGAHGAFTWGVMDELLADSRIEIDSISATSTGAMNAVLLAQGMVNNGRDGARKELEKFWQAVSENGKYLDPIKLTSWEALLGVNIDHSISYILFDLMADSLSPYQANPFNYHPLRTLLDNLIDYDQIKKFNKINLFISATNVKTGELKVFTNKEISTNVLLASACLPTLFQSVEIDGEYYWNGGYLGNPPIYPLIYDSTVSDILIIHINPIEREEIPKTANQILNRINEISFNSSLMREIRVISFVTKLIEQDWIEDKYKKNLRKINVHSIGSDELMETLSVASKLYTDWDFLTQLFEKGKESAKNWLKINYKKINKESSVDLQQLL